MVPKIITRNIYMSTTVLNSIRQIYEKMLKEYDEEQFEKQEEKNGFKLGCACIDGIFCVHQPAIKYLTYNLETHLIFIDLIMLMTMFL